MLMSRGRAKVRRLIAPLRWGLAALLLLAAVSAQEAPAPEAAPPQDPLTAKETALGEVQAEIRGQLDALATELEQARMASDESAAAHTERVMEVLRSTERTGELHMAAVVRSRDLAAELAEAQRQIDAGIGVAVDEPNLPALDALRDRLEQSQAEAEPMAAAVATATDALAVAKADQAAKEAERLKAAERVNTSDDPAAVLELRRALRLRELEYRLAQAVVGLRETEVANAEARAALRELRERLLTESVQAVAGNLQVTDEDLDEQRLRLREAQDDLTQRMSVAESRAAAAKARYVEAPTPPSAPVTVDDRVAVERHRALYLAHQRALLREQGLKNQLDTLKQDQELWDLRYQAARDLLSHDVLRIWRDKINLSLRDMRNNLKLEQKNLDEASEDLKAVDARIAQDPEAPEVGALRDQRTSLVSLVAIHEEGVASIGAAIKLRKRFAEELEAKTKDFSLVAWLDDVGDRLSVAWNYEFLDVDPSDDLVPLTPKKIVVAILLFVLGLVLARLTRRLLGSRIFPRFRLEEGASAAYQKLVFYFIVFMFFLLALNVLQVPLTAFTVLGGALAIGVGFGSQNLLNNFISGLIMLAERPIRVGDLIEIDNTYGIVEQIGARSTRVLTSDNINIVIPNSSFLENNVVNWTLSNDVIRSKVTVGVAYGSPTREVDRLIRHAVTEHGRVLKAPEPIVIFEDFGDNSLVFEIYFWLRARSVMAQRRVQSDVRFRIDNLFREAGITIAFPQRDVHVNSLAPLDVRLLPGDAAPAPVDPDSDETSPATDTGAGTSSGLGTGARAAPGAGTPSDLA